MKKVLLFIVVFYVGLVVFMPKENLYFTLQKYLKTQNIYINSNIKSNISNLTLENAKVFVNNINLVDFDKLNFYPLIVYNKLTINNININVQDLKIKTLNIVYSVINPLKILIKGDSNFGNLDGYVDLKNQDIKIYIKNPKKITTFLRKDKKGYYFYEKF